MIKRTVVGLVGQPGAGKTTVARHLARHFGFESVTVSSMISDFAEQHGLTLETRDDYSVAHQVMIKRLGEMSIPQAILKIPENRICFDGMRIPEHADYLQRHGARIIALHCPPNQRYERIVARHGTFDGLSYGDFLAVEERQSTTEVPFGMATETVMAKANFHLDSSVPPDQLFANVAALVRPLLNS